MKIYSGIGNGGYGAEVDSENRLKVLSHAKKFDRHVNEEGRYWSTYFTNTPTGANDYFFYCKNTGTSNLHITDIRISSSVTSQITYETVTGTAAGGSNCTIVNRQIGNSQIPVATIQQGVDITGLTGTIFDFEECNVANQLYHRSYSSTIIIPQGQSIAFKRIEATGLITCSVSISGGDQ